MATLIEIYGHTDTSEFIIMCLYKEFVCVIEFSIYLLIKNKMFRLFSKLCCSVQPVGCSLHDLDQSRLTGKVGMVNNIRR